MQDDGAQPQAVMDRAIDRVHAADQVDQHIGGGVVAQHHHQRRQIVDRRRQTRTQLFENARAAHDLRFL